MPTGVRFVGGQHPEFGSDADAVQPAKSDDESQAEPQRYPAEHIEGVPARDLTNEEWAALSDEQREAARATGLYDVSGAATRTENRLQAESSGETEGAS